MRHPLTTDAQGLAFERTLQHAQQTLETGIYRLRDAGTQQRAAELFGGIHTAAEFEREADLWRALAIAAVTLDPLASYRKEEATRDSRNDARELKLLAGLVRDMIQRHKQA